MRGRKGQGTLLGNKEGFVEKGKGTAPLREWKRDKFLLEAKKGCS